jgi:peptidoglycan/LPS O-acetylase OafA/YrhL
VIDLGSNLTPAPAHRAYAPRPSATGKDRITALDGLRGLALLIIMGFHFGVGWLQGGFFGIDIFYVLSGYLITGLLVSEYRKRGRVKLSAFWLRRARRLLPALLIMLVAVTLLVRYVAAPGLYPDFRLSALSVLFYFSNWWQIAAQSNYFVVTGPVSPLTHTWSLSVEEQFYLVWPLVVLGVMHLSRTFPRGIRALLVLSAVGAVASAVEMALLYNPAANTTRIYFGTDTHAQSILVGSVLACAMTLIQMGRSADGMAPEARSPWVRRVLGALGCAGVAVIASLSFWLDGSSSFGYRGGIMLSALSAAAIIIAAVSVPRGLVARGLSIRPLVWIGTVSYGAYLWHYPVYVFVNTKQTGLTGLSLLALRFACTFVLAAVSYYLVERPVMYGTFWRSLKAIAPAIGLVVATVAVVVAGTIGPATAAVHVNRYRQRPPDQPALAAAPGLQPPVLVVVGDSTALTLGAALIATAPPGTTVVNRGLFGCGLAIGTEVSNNPPQPGLAMFPECNAASPVSGQWPAFDVSAVAGTSPGDLVLFVAGPWEVQDILRNGQWTDIQQPSFQNYELAQMRLAVKIGTAHGAHFAFTTLPAQGVGAAFNQSPFPEDSTIRRMIYDRLIETVAREFPSSVSVIDYGKLLSPNGVFTEYIDGVQVRTPDGIHTPSYAPGNVFEGNSSAAVAHAFYNWLSPRIWPLIIAANPSPTTTPTPATTPSSPTTPTTPRASPTEAAAPQSGSGAGSEAGHP